MYRVTSLTLRSRELIGHDVTWPFYSLYVISYRRAIDCDWHQPANVNCFRLWSLKSIAATLTFRVTWCHRSRDHSTRTVRFPTGGLLIPSSYLVRLPRYACTFLLKLASRYYGLKGRGRRGCRETSFELWTTIIGRRSTLGKCFNARIEMLYGIPIFDKMG